jgi:hypothetical protein
VGLVPPILLTYKNFNGGNPILNFLSAIFVYLVALYASITVYRVSPFHPLAAYPGPALARISRFWAMAQFIGGKQHILSHELFNRYGPVVRTGPNHLLFRDAKAVSTILGARDPWPKHTSECL